MSRQWLLIIDAGCKSVGCSLCGRTLAPPILGPHRFLAILRCSANAAGQDGSECGESVTVQSSKGRVICTHTSLGLLLDSLVVRDELALLGVLLNPSLEALASRDRPSSHQGAHKAGAGRRVARGLIVALLDAGDGLAVAHRVMEEERSSAKARRR